MVGGDLSGGQFDSHFHRVVISVRGPVIDLGGPRHLRVKGEDSMNIAYVSLCDEEIIDEVSCAKPGVPPGRFVALSRLATASPCSLT